MLFFKVFDLSQFNAYLILIILCYNVVSYFYFSRRYRKNRILVQGRSGAEFSREAGFPARSNSLCGSQTGGILESFENLKRGTNKDIGPKDIFEIAPEISL